jgi:hypothetical protein
MLLSKIKTIILPVLLYGCATWSLILREERRLRVSDNRAFRRIFGPNRDEITVQWRKLHNEELNDLYSSPNIVRVIKTCSFYVGVRSILLASLDKVIFANTLKVSLICV